MKTQKEAIQIYKTTYVTVMAFENGKRYSTYGGVDIITALNEVTIQAKNGRQVLILPDDCRECMKYEIKNKSRVPFEVMQPYALSRVVSVF